MLSSVGLAVVICSVLLVAPLAAQSIQLDRESAEFFSHEYTEKLKVLQAFGMYTQWVTESPRTNRDAPFVIAIAGDHPYRKQLAKHLETLTIQRRKVVVKQFSTLEEAPQCDLLYVTNAISRSFQKQLVNKYQGQTVFTVGENAGFLEDGGMAQIQVRHGKVEFQFDRNLARLQGLLIDSRLAKLSSQNPGQRNDSPEGGKTEHANPPPRLENLRQAGPSSPSASPNFTSLTKNPVEAKRGPKFGSSPNPPRENRGPTAPGNRHPVAGFGTQPGRGGEPPNGQRPSGGQR